VGLFYYVMEYLDGISLQQLVERHGPQPEGRVIDILRQVCGSLAEAHAAGLIHRDIKPANIVLNHRGGVPDFIKVLDFGLAKLISVERQANVTLPGALTGTPHSLAPESIQHSEQADARADLYAVGGVGYFLLTGTTVFSGPSIIDICVQQCEAEPEPPSRRLGRPLGSRLEALLLRCLAKKPQERPASAAALEQELAGLEVSDWSARDAEAWWQWVKQAPPGGPATVLQGQVMAGRTAVYQRSQSAEPEGSSQAAGPAAP
jgi:serine/threonine protein kinase